jgi:pimeloyl-ACP methyl ester carboxylesterase
MPYADNSGVRIYWEEQGAGDLGAQASLPASFRTGDDPSHATPGRQGCLRYQGDPVLLIMGLGYTLDMWYRTVPALSQRYRTISFDNRGVGRSGVPPGPYPIAAMAADAAAVMDSAGVTRAHVFGISMGGMIAQEFALQYPQRTRSFTIDQLRASGLKRTSKSGGGPSRQPRATSRRFRASLHTTRSAASLNSKCPRWLCTANRTGWFRLRTAGVLRG